MNHTTKATKVLPGQVYGRLTVLEPTLKLRRRSHIQQQCRCTCGNVVWVIRGNLRTGTTTSCGCAKSEVVVARNLTHGCAGNSTYTRWNAMIQRCANPNDKMYHRYGGRGITVCDRWLQFEAFLGDMGEAPDGLCLDRIDNDKGYYKENCRWTTWTVNNNNRNVCQRTSI